MDKQVTRDQERELEDLSSDELEAQEVAELPDREALSLVSTGGLGSFTPLDGVHSQAPADINYDTIQPMPPDRVS